MAGATSRLRLLVVDDSADTRELLLRNLASQGYDVVAAADVPEALRVLDSGHVDLVITDYKMPGTSGLDLVKYVRDNLKDTEIMMITGYPSVEGAVAAVKSGAEEYLSKPFTREELLASVTRAIEKLRLRQSGSAHLERRVATTLGLVGESAAMQEVFRAIARVAGSLSPALILGENGTGKRLIARAIHDSSTLSKATFVTVNCLDYPEDQFERLFRGQVLEPAQGRVEIQAGWLGLADGGTLYLEEITELPHVAQTVVAHALEEKAYRPLGATQSTRLNLRLLVGASRDLRVLVNRGTFREDLFIRLTMQTIAVPTLQERDNDVLLLAGHFLDRFSRELGRRVPRFSDHALEAVKNYPWPGNVTELQNLMHRLVSKADLETIDVPDLPPSMRAGMFQKAILNRSLAELELEHIRNVIANVGGNKTQAAEILGITRKTLREKLKHSDRRKSS